MLTSKLMKPYWESRSGLCICEKEIVRLNVINSPLVQQGQSVHQIYVSHKDELMCSDKAIYNNIVACLPDVSNIMDSVIGTRCAKCLLTIHFVETNLMLAFLRESNTSQSMIDVYNGLYKKLGHGLFEKLFHVTLTDNSGEFSNPKAIEYGPKHDNFRTRIFYKLNNRIPYETFIFITEKRFQKNSDVSRFQSMTSC